MAVTFSPFFQFTPLDDEATPTWLMVPQGETRRVLVGPPADFAAVDLISDTPAVAEVVRRTAFGLVEIQGNTPGTAFILARDNGGRVAGCLEVSVKRPLKISTAFLFVTDIAGRTSNRASTDADTMLATMNDLYTAQTNVVFVGTKPRPFDFTPMDLGDPIVYDNVEQTFTKVAAATNCAYTVFFVWNVTTKEVIGHNINGVTRINGTHSMIPKSATDVTVAHEAGHFFGLPSVVDPKLNDCLVFCSGKRTGTKIPRDFANQINDDGSSAAAVELKRKQYITPGATVPTP